VCAGKILRGVGVFVIIITPFIHFAEVDGLTHHPSHTHTQAVLLFKCPRCKFQADRDINSSKNHLLKALVGKKNY